MTDEADTYSHGCCSHPFYSGSYSGCAGSRKNNGECSGMKSKGLVWILAGVLSCASVSLLCLLSAANPVAAFNNLV